MQVTLNITRRGGPPDNIEIRGTKPDGVREQIFYLHHNLRDSEKVLPGRGVVFESTRKNVILDIIRVADLATKRDIPLEAEGKAARNPDAAFRFLTALIEEAGKGDHEPALDEMIGAEAKPKGRAIAARPAPSAARPVIRPDKSNKNRGRVTARSTGYAFGPK